MLLYDLLYNVRAAQMHTDYSIKEVIHYSWQKITRTRPILKETVSCSDGKLTNSICDKRYPIHTVLDLQMLAGKMTEKQLINCQNN